MTYSHKPSWPLRETRFKAGQERAMGIVLQDPIALYYGRQPGAGWRFVVEQGGFATVGPAYATETELLSDMTRYASTWGLNG
jgi:hypothetical protein